MATDVGAGEVRLGSYRIVRRIASGGMGTVYLAQRESWTRDFSKPVALKVMHPHLAREASFVRMFLDEARVAIQIEHPHVCNVIEVGVANGSHFIVMEYLNGKTLGQIVKEVQALGLSEEAKRDFFESYQQYVARIIADAADGLHAAHEARSADGQPLEIVHRDVSPHNIMVTFSGAVKVVDFGIAHAKERLEQTESGLVKGKLKYASPEQISGKGVDKRTDVWSLGVCLWEAVTLKHPFGQTDQAEVVASITKHQLPDLNEIAPWVNPELELIVRRALSADRSARYNTAREMSAALRAFLLSSRAMVEAAELGDWLQVLSPAQAAGAPGVPLDAVSISEISDVSTGALVENQPVTHNERPGPPVAETTPEPAFRRKRHPVAWAVASAAALALIITTLVVTRSDAHTNTVAPVVAPLPPTAPVADSEPVVTAVAAPEGVTEPAMIDVDALQLEPTEDPLEAIAAVPKEKKPVVKRTVIPSAVLNVVAVGGTVEVWVDGKRKGNSPLKIDVPSGQHDVRLVDLSSGESSDQTVTFITGVERSMRVELGN
ncbi:MAG: serine/threonine protein kinase [Archangium sp.]